MQHTSSQASEIKWSIEERPDPPAQALGHIDDEVLQIGHGGDGVAEVVDAAAGVAVLEEGLELAQLAAGIVEAHILDEGAATRARGQRLGEGEVVLGGLEGDALVQQRVGEGIQAVVDEADGAQVVLVGQAREDEVEQLVREGIEPVRLGGGRGGHDGAREEKACALEMARDWTPQKAKEKKRKKRRMKL